MCSPSPVKCCQPHLRRQSYSVLGSPSQGLTSCECLKLAEWMREWKALPWACVHVCVCVWKRETEREEDLGEPSGNVFLSLQFVPGLVGGSRTSYFGSTLALLQAFPGCFWDSWRHPLGNLDRLASHGLPWTLVGWTTCPGFLKTFLVLAMKGPHPNKPLSLGQT